MVRLERKLCHDDTGVSSSLNAESQGERMAGVEPAWTVLQTAALPLGHTRIDPIMFVVNNSRQDCDQGELIAM